MTNEMKKLFTRFDVQEYLTTSQRQVILYKNIKKELLEYLGYSIIIHDNVYYVNHGNGFLTSFNKVQLQYKDKNDKHEPITKTEKINKRYSVRKEKMMYYHSLRNSNSDFILEVTKRNLDFETLCDMTTKHNVCFLERIKFGNNHPLHRVL